MKKTFKFAALALCAAAFAISCDKSEIEISVTPKVGTRTFTCVIDNDDTKVAYTPDGAKMKVTWEVGDEILLHAGENEREVVVLTADNITNGGKTAVITPATEFTHYGSSYTTNVYAIYPASAVTSTEYLWYETRVSKFDIPPMGGYDDGGSTITFKNLCGVLCFKVKGDFDKYEFAGNNGEIVAYYPDYQCRLALTTGGSLDYRRTSANGANSTPSKVATGAVVADGSTLNYVCIPEGANLASGFTFKFYKNDELKKIAKTEKAANIKTNQYWVLGDISSHLEDYVAPQHSDHTSAITGATDLSAQQANCYVISAAGAYKFPALQGNSEEAAGEVFDVELVWETYNTETSVTANSVIEAVDFENNWIYFKTPETLKPGNALIAAKGVDGKIIWSWHIWIPETAYTVSDFGISSVNMMSRNLGALVDAEVPAEGTVDVRSFGLFYQWGRKDPFVSSKRVNTSSHALVAGTDWTKNGGQMTIAETIQKPTVFADFKGDWLAAHDNELWGDHGAKTIYDPCPAGYRVAKQITSDNMWKKVIAIDGFEASATGLYWKLGTAVFPIAGYIYYNGSISGVGTKSVIWNIHRNSDEVGYCQYVFYENEVWASEPGWGQRKACGLNVRCIVDAVAE